jgi:hypothetical protein
MDVGMAEAGQSCDEPLHREKKDALIRTFWQRPGYGDQPLCRWDVDLVDQDATRAGWTTSRACGSVLGLFGTCDRLLEPQEGATFCSLDGYYALKGPTSPLRGLTPSFLAHFGILACKSDK